MKGDRQILKHILPLKLVILAHSLKEGLFVTYDVVVLEVIMDFYSTGNQFVQKGEAFISRSHLLAEFLFQTSFAFEIQVPPILEFRSEYFTGI